MRGLIFDGAQRMTSKMIIKRYYVDWVFAIDVLLLRHYDTVTNLYMTHTTREQSE